MCVSLVLACTSLGAFATPVVAQPNPHVEASGGYNLLKFPHDTLPAGWYADVAVPIGGTVSAVGQVSGNYETIDFPSAGGFRVGEHTFMGGGRVTGRLTPTATVFGQALVGAVYSSAGSICQDCSEADAALQIGGGTNLMAGQVGLRIGLDYLRIFFTGNPANTMRFSAGVVYRFSAR